MPSYYTTSGSPRSGKRTDSLVKLESKIPTQFPLWLVAQWLERATRIRKTLDSIPGGAALCFSSDPAVTFSIFVGVEREENLIRNNPDKSEFTSFSCIVHEVRSVRETSDFRLQRLQRHIFKQDCRKSKPILVGLRSCR